MYTQNQMYLQQQIPTIQQQTPVYYAEGCTTQVIRHPNQIQLVYCPHVDSNDVIIDEQINCVLPPNEKNIGGLYIGNYQSALSSQILLKYHVKSVLTTSKETPVQYQPSLIPFSLQLDMSDNDELNLESFFYPSNEFIENGMKFGNVLVHCHLGISRSAAIILGYLMKHKQWTLEKSLWVLKVKRPIINPNVGFMECLFAYELKLFGRNSLIAQEKKSSTLPGFLKEILKKSPSKIVRNHQIVNRDQQNEYVPLNKSYHFDELPPDSLNNSQILNISQLSSNNHNRQHLKIISYSPSKNTSFHVNYQSPPGITSRSNLQSQILQ